MKLKPADAARFIRSHTILQAPPLIPEIRLWTAAEATALWEASENFLEEVGLQPPFWAFPWAGGQALARYILDRPETVAGKRTLDFGSGSGLVAIAALLAGARTATAADLDPLAAVAATLNGEANGCAPTPFVGDAISLDPGAFDIILAGDVCYDRRQADPSSAWLFAASQEAETVLIGDPGRAYFPRHGLDVVAEYQAVTPLELEKADITATRVWRARRSPI